MQGFIRRQIPVIGAAARDDGAGVRRDRDRRRPVAHARPLAGRALVRDPVRARPARLLHARRDIMGALVNRRITTVAAARRRRRDHRLNVFLLVRRSALPSCRPGSRRCERPSETSSPDAASPSVSLEVAERVDGVAVDAHLEVEVRPEAVAGAADVADHLALAHLLAAARRRSSSGGRRRSRGCRRGRSRRGCRSPLPSRSR